MNVSTPEMKLNFVEVVSERNIAPDDLPDGDLAKAMRLLAYVRDRLNEIGEAWAPVEIGAASDPITKSVCDLFLIGAIRLAVASDETGKLYVILQPRG